MQDIRASIVRQFHAPIKMLSNAIAECPEPLWLSGSPNRIWHLAYHALFYTHFYLAPSEAEFVPWAKSRTGYNFLGEPPRQAGARTVVDSPYTRAELLEYACFCTAEAELQVTQVDLAAPSGFHWLPFDKLELQLYNIRHLQHHVGQFADRLRSQAGLGLAWVG
jgi:hypothetical protein